MQLDIAYYILIGFAAASFRCNIAALLNVGRGCLTDYSKIRKALAARRHTNSQTRPSTQLQKFRSHDDGKNALE